MISKRGVGASLWAAFQPVPQSMRDPVFQSRSVKDAIRRMEKEAEELQEAASSHRPFCQTLKHIMERM